MNQYIFIGIAAGLGTALLNLAGFSGGPVGLGFILVLISHLPVMIATLGWGSFTGLIATIASGVTVAIILGPLSGFIFFLLNNLPAFWIAHLAGLSRTDSETGETEYYPLGNLLLWIAGIASAASLSMFVPHGFDLDKFRASISGMLGQIYKFNEQNSAAPMPITLEQLTDLFVTLAPVISGIILVLTLVINLYLAAKVVAMSDRLARPWPDMHTVSMPLVAIVIFMVALVISSFGGILGLISQAIAAAFGAALLLIGLSVLHFITRKTSSRTGLLVGTYLMLVLFGWLGLALVVLGAGELLFNIRSRFPHLQGPSGPSDNGSSANQ